MESVTQLTVNFVIINVRSLEAGLQAKAFFDEDGGVIGSAMDAVWRLSDRSQSIRPYHCEITFVDDAFCIKDLCGETYINASNMPLGVNNLARLNNEDEITIGEYEVRVLFNGDTDIKRGSHSLEQLFSNKGNSLIDGSAADTAFDEPFDDTEIVVEELDPLAIFDQTQQTNSEEDLIDGTQDEEEPEDFIKDLSGQAHRKPGFTLQADTDNDITAAVGLNVIRKEKVRFSKSMATEKMKNFISKSFFSSRKMEEETADHSTDLNVKECAEPNTKEVQSMNDNMLDLLEQEMAKNYSKETKEDDNYLVHDQSVEGDHYGNNHMLRTPLTSGLAVNIGNNASVEQMQALSNEIGSTLRACVEGLLDLHNQVKDSRYGMMHRSLQPIEDNPLRLGLSYEDTIRTMFDENKSAVHLSAKASVEESLKMIKNHNEAVQYATNIALGQILKALSPDTLLKRFSRYNRDVTQNCDEKSWAWDMYESYYKELTSNRQQGFEKLFWEIFEQSYDTKLREKHAE